MPVQHLAKWLLIFCLGGGGVYLAAVAAIGLSTRARPSDLAVVFGNSVSANRHPSNRLAARLDTVVALHRNAMVKQILVSGGIEQPGNLDEAAVMAHYLEEKGVPASMIVQDPDGINTLETARHAAERLGAGGSVIVVTQWFHLPRAMLAMRMFGIRKVSGAWPLWFELRDAYSFLREAIALPFYWFKGVKAPAVFQQDLPQQRS